MNIYEQYLALLQIFFHHQDKKTPPREKPPTVFPVSKKELFREAA